MIVTVSEAAEAGVAAKMLATTTVAANVANRTGMDLFLSLAAGIDGVLVAAPVVLSRLEAILSRKAPVGPKSGGRANSA
ncbi:hypothetical protein [Amycolatopsis minnesotensis]|uniref:Uncharacterized protein n=1 Tax=Amycolatopsis minnesotensis TaxID=337894 RepID=A0ABP5DHV2_9PSEU